MIKISPVLILLIAAAGFAGVLYWQNGRLNDKLAVSERLRASAETARDAAKFDIERMALQRDLARREIERRDIVLKQIADMEGADNEISDDLLAILCTVGVRAAEGICSP